MCAGAPKAHDDAESRDLPGAREAVEKAIPDRPPFGVLVPEMGRGLSQFCAVTLGDSLEGLPRVGIFGQTFRCPIWTGSFQRRSLLAPDASFFANRARCPITGISRALGHYSVV